jgi:Flp pilus assembly pilin Flp
MSLAKRFLTDESGAIVIEYGLIAAGISVLLPWSMVWALR